MPSMRKKPAGAGRRPKRKSTRTKAKAGASRGAVAPRAAVAGPVSQPPAKRGALPALTLQLARQPADLRIRTATGATFALDAGAAIERDVMIWGYSLRNRDRWRDGDDLRSDHAQRSADLLKRLGLTSQDLEVIARASVAEVEVPYVKESEGWALRLLPWEFVLSTATHEARAGRPLTVVRWLHRAKPLAPARPPLGKVLFVESAPGGLRDEFEFASEHQLVEGNLPLEVVQLRDPTLTKLGETIRAHRPDIVHLGGCDNHQAAALLKEKSPESQLDGYVLLGERHSVDYVDAQRLADALTGFGAHLPSFVAFNFYNAAGRLAPMAVAQGCGAAIGFQDLMDDELAEVFWSNFYAAWARSQQGLFPAFEAARLVLRAQGRSHYGTGVALWTESSIAGAPALAAAARGPETERLERVLTTEKMRPVLPEDVKDRENAELVKVDVRTEERVSYSLLHNGRGLFTRFELHKLVPGRMTEVSVEAKINFGNDSIPYSETIELTENRTSLADKVHVALTSELSRTPSESIRTSVWTQVRWGGRTLHEATESVTVLPADEWTDTDSDRQWLPSFVFRSDPAVLRVVDGAQRYLVALTDDPTAGFGGYQNIDAEADDPYLGVDQQVRALWYALTHDIALAYINPPPSSTSLTQRLRTPSDVLGGNRGTCIDLALLLAACLEYIDVYPAIVLLEGHAFPAYWRSDTAHDAFREEWQSARLDTPETAEPQNPARPPVAHTAQWLLPKAAYRGILQQVHKGNLVPLEAVWLTQRSGFNEAVEEGVSNLRSKSDFQCLIDINLARVFGVTPLPLLRRRDA